MAIKRPSRARGKQNENQENTVNETPNFEDNTVAEDNLTPTEVQANELDVDVDAPQAAAEDTVTTEGTSEAPTDKPAKKESARPPVPEGKVSPVQFAKILSKHLSEKRGEEVTVAPQVVYSYIKNNGPESKNPFPAERSEGRTAVVDADAAIAWWDAKDQRVAASKTAAAEKAAKKADKATNKGGETVTELPAQEQPELVEAE